MPMVNVLLLSVPPLTSAPLTLLSMRQNLYEGLKHLQIAEIQFAQVNFLHHQYCNLGNGLLKMHALTNPYFMMYFESSM